VRPSIVLLLAFLANLSAPSLAAQRPAPATPPTITVGLYVSPPFVMKDGDRYSGMAIDLWEGAARRLGVDSDYKVLPTFSSLLDATARGDVDVAVTNLTITQDRARRIDFTQPWYDAGLRIMVGQQNRTSFWGVVAGLKRSGHLRAYAWLAALVIAGTVLLTLFDRHFDEDFPRKWTDGLAESFYQAVSVATSGKTVGRKKLFGSPGRILAAFWMVCGVAIVAYVTSSITSVMTTEAITGRINSKDDLPGRTVGAFVGSVAESHSREMGLNVRSYRNMKEAANALMRGEIEAIVGDAPVLEYYAHTHPESKVAVVGPIFEPDKYGFGVTRNHALARPITLQVLGAHESDLVESLKIRYFGTDS